MAKDKSSKTPAEASADGSSNVDAPEAAQIPSKRRRGIFSFFRSNKSKSSKNRAGKVTVELSSDNMGQNNNRPTRSASFSEPGSSKEQPRKVKQHLSVSRSGKMKELRTRPSLNELTKRFEAQAQV